MRSLSIFKPVSRVSTIDMTILRNPYTILLLVLLLMTLAAFFLRFLPYPVGILVLIALLMMRIRSVRNKHQGRPQK